MTSQTPEERPNIEETNDFPELEKQYVAMRDKGEFEWNHHDGDELGKKPISPWRIWTTFIKPTLHHQLQKDHQHILAVLKEGVEEMKLTYVFSGVNWKDTDMESNQVIYGYNQAIKDVEALLQETLGEGKEINSIFKE